MATRLKATIKDLYHLPEDGKAEIVNGQLKLPGGSCARFQLTQTLHDYCHIRQNQRQAILPPWPPTAVSWKIPEIQGTIGLGNGGPNKHSAARFFNLPTYRIKPIAEHIAVFPVQTPDLSQAFLRPLKRHNCSHLDRRKHAIIEV